MTARRVHPKLVDLWDRLAGMAMQSMVAGDGARMVAARDERYDETNWAEIIAGNSYNFADAMLEERQRRLGFMSPFVDPSKTGDTQ